MGCIFSCCTKKNRDNTQNLLNYNPNLKTSFRNRNNSERSIDIALANKENTSKLNENILIDFSSAESAEDSRRRFITVNNRPEEHIKQVTEHKTQINLPNNLVTSEEPSNLEDETIQKEEFQLKPSRTRGITKLTNTSESHLCKKERVELSFKMKNNLEELYNSEFLLEILNEIEEDKYELIAQTVNSFKGEFFDFDIRPIIDFIFGKSQNIKCIIKTSNGVEISLKISLGKIVGSKKLIIPLNYKENREIFIDYQFNPNPEEYSKSQILLIEISSDFLKKQNSEQLFSTLSVSFKLNLPVIPPKSLYYCLKKNSLPIYTSELQTSSRDFSFMGNIFNLNLFSKEELDKDQEVTNSKFVLEFYEKNEEGKKIFAITDEVYSNQYCFIKNSDLTLKSPQSNKVIGKTKLGYSEKSKISFASALDD